MSRLASMRLIGTIVLALTLLPAAAFAQSQDTQSVADAARRTREQKKAAAKPARVVTDDDVKPATPASTEPAPAPGAPAPGTPNPSPAAAPAGAAPDAKDESASKEITELKEQIKQTQSDLDLLQRQLALEQDSYLSNPEHARDTAGKAKVDGLKQQAGEKKSALDLLKARLAEMQPSPPPAPAAPPKP